jgi:hypothetical protein
MAGVGKLRRVAVNLGETRRCQLCPVTDVEDALPVMPVQLSRCQDLANACIAASRVGS